MQQEKEKKETPMWKERKRGEYEKELVVEVETPISFGKKGKGGLVGKREVQTTLRKGRERKEF